jgi:hypothetical protein
MIGDPCQQEQVSLNRFIGILVAQDQQPVSQMPGLIRIMDFRRTKKLIIIPQGIGRDRY